MNKKIVKSTDFVRANVNPTWKTSFIFHVPTDLLSQTSVEVAVLDHNDVSASELIGTVSIPLSSITFGTATRRWHKLGGDIEANAEGKPVSFDPANPKPEQTGAPLGEIELIIDHVPDVPPRKPLSVQIKRVLAAIIPALLYVVALLSAIVCNAVIAVCDGNQTLMSGYAHPLNP